jgi:uncharacterized protein
VSKGAEAALLIAARDSEIDAVVAGVPSSVVWPGIAWDATSSTQPLGSSWSEKGQPVPYLPYGKPRQMTKIADLYLEGLTRLGEFPAAVIPVERVRGRVLLVCGEADTLWPSCEMSRAVAARARAHQTPQVTLLAYEHAGHAAIGRPSPAGAPPSPMLAATGGTVEGNHAARTDGWPKVVAFLKEALRR